MCIKNKINRLVKESALIKKNDDYYNFGVTYFGPFLYGFIKWLSSLLKENNYKKVFFFSRDGFMMEKAFRIFNKTKDISTSYVYFSRKSIRQALLHYCVSFEDSLKYLTWERYITIGKLLEYYGFTEKERIAIADAEGFDLETDMDYENIINNSLAKAFYEKYLKQINLYSMQQDKLLELYIKQIGLIGDCAIVDIGWHGSMQFFLEEYCCKKNLNIRFHGFYVGILPNVPIKGNVDGYLYNPQKPYMRKSVLCFFGGYEKLFQSCEGSTYGYSVEKEKIIPVLADYEYAEDASFIKRIKELQKGAMDFFMYAYKNNYQLHNPTDWALLLIKFGKNPSLSEIKLFSNFYNVDGTKIYYVSQKPLYKYKLKEFVHALSNSAWKTGFMKSVFKIPLPYFRVYCLLRK